MDQKQLPGAAICVNVILTTITKDTKNPLWIQDDYHNKNNNYTNRDEQKYNLKRRTSNAYISSFIGNKENLKMWKMKAAMNLNMKI